VQTARKASEKRIRWVEAAVVGRVKPGIKPWRAVTHDCSVGSCMGRDVALLFAGRQSTTDTDTPGGPGPEGSFPMSSKSLDLAAASAVGNPLRKALPTGLMRADKRTNSWGRRLIAMGRLGMRAQRAENVALQGQPIPSRGRGSGSAFATLRRTSPSAAGLPPHPELRRRVTILERLNDMGRRANNPAPANPATMASFHPGHQWRRIAGPGG